MKDQTNLIVIIVAIVFMIGFTLAFALGQRKTVVIKDPTPVPTAPVAPAEGAVVYANALPNAGKGPATGGAGGGSGVPGAGGSQGTGGIGAPGRGPITAGVSGTGK